MSFVSRDSSSSRESRPAFHLSGCARHGGAHRRHRLWGADDRCPRHRPERPRHRPCHRPQHRGRGHRDHRRLITQGRTPAFGDLGVLSSGVGSETLDGLLSGKGLLRFARARGLELERIEALWSEPQDAPALPEVVEAFTTAIVTAVSAVAVTLDPESVYFVGRLSPLAEDVLPEARRRLANSLPSAPEIRVVPQVLGLSVARGAAYAGQALAQARLRDGILGTPDAD